VRSASAYGSDHNPFDSSKPLNMPHRQSAYSPQAKKSTASESTELKPTAYKAAAAPRQSVSGMQEDDIIIREQALSRRETVLAEKEKELEAREKKLGPWAKYKPPNWPCECYPITYHNISEEIPENHKTLVRKFYAHLLFAWVGLFWNWLTLLVIWASDAGGSTGSSDALWSSIFLVAGLPGAWKLWYRPLYNGVKDSKGGQWIMFFLFFFAHMVFAAILGLGVPSCAASGLFMMIKMFGNSHSLAGIFCLISVIVWSIEFLVCIYLGKQAHSTWKRMGGEEELKKDMAKRAVEHSMTSALTSGVASDAV